MTAVDIRRAASLAAAGAVAVEITADGIRLRDDLVCPPPRWSLT